MRDFPGFTNFTDKVGPFNNLININDISYNTDDTYTKAPKNKMGLYILGYLTKFTNSFLTTNSLP